MAAMRNDFDLYFEDQNTQRLQTNTFLNRQVHIFEIDFFFQAADI